MDAQESADTRIVDPARLPFAYQDALNAGDLEAMLPDGTGISPTGTTTAVARRSADGSWRFAILDCQGAVGSPGWS
jgi:hypothetical protein